MRLVRVLAAAVVAAKELAVLHLVVGVLGLLAKELQGPAV